MLTKKRIYVNPSITFERCQITLKRTFKYLGVTINSRPSFRRHCGSTLEKTSASAGAISRFMPNIGGLSHKTRELLMLFLSSKFFYSALTWTKTTMKFDLNNRLITRALRTASLCVIRAYLSVSVEVALFLTKVPSGDLPVLERCRIYERTNDPDRAENMAKIKSAEWTITIFGRQARWFCGLNVAWTRKVLRGVKGGQPKKLPELSYDSDANRS